MRVVVTGANRGLGLEFVKHVLDRGDRVVAAVRNPERAEELHRLQRGVGAERLSILKCDVADDASVVAFATALGTEAVDLLVNNAGTMARGHDGLDSLDFADALQVINVNALGALRVTVALLPALKRARRATVVHLTSGLGSIGDNTSGGLYAYRMSKAALNMASRSLASDLASDGIVSVVFNPGWVRTDMGGAGASISADESVTSMLRQIEKLNEGSSGRFFNWRGGEYPW